MSELPAHGPRQGQMSHLPLRDRTRLLDEAIAMMLRRRGRRLEFYSEVSAIVARGRPINHAIHAIFILLTGGIWLVGWLILIGVGGEERHLIYVEPDGRVQIKRIQRA